MIDDDNFSIGPDDAGWEDDDDVYSLAIAEEDAYLMTEWAHGGAGGPQYLRGLNPTDQLHAILAAAQAAPDAMNVLIEKVSPTIKRIYVVDHIVGDC